MGESGSQGSCKRLPVGPKCLGGQMKGRLVTYLARLLDERILTSLSIYFSVHCLSHQMDTKRPNSREEAMAHLAPVCSPPWYTISQSRERLSQGHECRWESGQATLCSDLGVIVAPIPT